MPRNVKKFVFTPQDKIPPFDSFDHRVFVSIFRGNISAKYSVLIFVISRIFINLACSSKELVSV